MKINTGGEVGYEIDLMSPPSSEFINRSNSTSAMAVTKEGLKRKKLKNDDGRKLDAQEFGHSYSTIYRKTSYVNISEKLASFIISYRRPPLLNVDHNRWKRALMKVADLSGLVLSGYGSDPITIDVNIS
ncbi:hypothetical protein E3N88_09875 [Mikania micrantha]|uniref:Uncharacterized protein n=1 Tax=Mikania micrantha TaxID=192012 RepID=A0A5N6PKA5_9ASTR|nr:hypothetical protein E3N88_09875 [Mikania micrantha]